MNLLFVNYGDFTSNSANHLAGFTAALTAAGHDCVVAVPGNLDSLSVVPHPRFRAATYDQLLAEPAAFADGRPADIIHAWTPREGVRRFVLAYRHLAASRVIVHLEDNEEHLLQAYMRRDLALLRDESPLDYPKALPDLLSIPYATATSCASPMASQSSSTHCARSCPPGFRCCHCRRALTPPLSARRRPPPACASR